MLRLVGDPFQFDLLARKAADLLSIGEEVLRKEARGPPTRSATPSRFARERAQTPNPPPAPAGGGGPRPEGENGPFALARLHPGPPDGIAQASAKPQFGT